MLLWRPAQPVDVPAISDVAAIVHPGLPERDVVFAERIVLSPEGCHVLEDGTRIVGYMLSHPWIRGAPPSLDTLLRAIPDDADCWYLHDIALMPAARGSGAARSIATQLEEQARRRSFPAMALVAVGDAAPLWRKLGFEDAAVAPDKLARYGAGAAYMEKRLQG